MADLKRFEDFVRATCSPGSNLPGSYVRALRYISELLRVYVPKYADIRSVWEIDSLDRIEELYRFVKSEEHKGTESVFSESKLPKSYFKQRYCTSALKALGRFVSLVQREKQAMDYYEQDDDAKKVAADISRLPILKPEMYLNDDVMLTSKVGKDTIRMVKLRQNQDLFRRMVLLNYGHVCCLTGMPVEEVLRASHIVGWAEDEKTRLMPTNGLCLAATYDAAFDRHLISFDEDFRLILSPTLHEYMRNDTFIRVFKSYEGKRLASARKFQPSLEFMRRHREQMK